jgi:antitoxin component YwqK of YwqJK toxin-antitoxin module
MSGTVLTKLKSQLGKLQASKGTLKFPVDKPLGAPLLRKLVKARLAEASTPKKNGRATAYYENGVVSWRGGYKGGKMHGKWEFFRKDTSLMRSGSFTSGKQCGTWRTFDRQGRMVTETEL